MMVKRNMFAAMDAARVADFVILILSPEEESREERFFMLIEKSRIKLLIFFSRLWRKMTPAREQGGVVGYGRRAPARARGPVREVFGAMLGKISLHLSALALGADSWWRERYI